MSAKPSTETSEEMERVDRAGGFQLRKAAISGPFADFLREYGEVSPPVCTELPPEDIVLYALIKPFKKDLTGKTMEEDLRLFLGKYGVVNTCPCNLIGGDDRVMVINAHIRKADTKDPTERADVVRARRDSRRKKS